MEIGSQDFTRVPIDSQVKILQFWAELDFCYFHDFLLFCDFSKHDMIFSSDLNIWSQLNMHVWMTLITVWLISFLFILFACTIMMMWVECKYGLFEVVNYRLLDLRDWLC